MEWTIPGTVLTAPKAEAAYIPEQFRAMFMAGGMVLSQVAAITGLESYMIQNWVKRGFLTSPQNKRYTLRQLCRIININMLKNALPMEQICGLLGYINGNLHDESDDLIDDSALYFMFVQLAARARHIGGNQEWGEAIESVLRDYDEPIPGAKERVAKVLRIMLTAWIAAQVRQQAELAIQALQEEETEMER